MPDESPHNIEVKLQSTDPDSLIVTRRELQLEMRGLKSDIRLLILASVALNQFLAAIAVPSFVTGAGVLGLLAWKGASLAIARNS